MVLVDGIHRDIGVALAGHMKGTPKFMALPRKRIVKALKQGGADVLCRPVGRKSPTGAFRHVRSALMHDGQTLLHEHLLDKMLALAETVGWHTLVLLVSNDNALAGGIGQLLGDLVVAH